MSRDQKTIFIALAVLFALGMTTAIIFRRAIGHAIALHEGESAACIFGMTFGKAGLMK